MKKLISNEHSMNSNEIVALSNVSARYVLSIIAGCACIVAVVFVCNRLIHTFVINVVLKIAFSVICYAGVLLAFKNDTALSIIAGIRTKNK